MIKFSKIIESHPCTPFRIPSLPVSSEALLGEHTDDATWKSVKRRPDSANLFICGVCRDELMFAPKSPHPKSSGKKMTMFGRVFSCCVLLERAIQFSMRYKQR